MREAREVSAGQDPANPDHGRVPDSIRSAAAHGELALASRDPRRDSIAGRFRIDDREPVLIWAATRSAGDVADGVIRLAGRATHAIVGVVTGVSMTGQDPMTFLAGLKKWFVRGASRSEKQLVLRCRGDSAQAERLIRHELTRRPRLTRAEASRAALERWNRDR